MLPLHRAWASDVQLAFAERDWTEYLIPPDEGDEKFNANPRIALNARAFLSQAIPFQYRTGMEHCDSAADLFFSLQQQYGSTTHEDEFRLEAQLMFMRKLPSNSVDQYVAKFKTHIAAVMAQQDPTAKYKDDKRHQLFLATLEYSDIPDEKWENFIPFLGNTWKSMTPEALFSATRTYYIAHILPKKTKTSVETSNAVEGSVYYTQGSTSKNTNSGNNNGNNNGNHGQSNQGQSNRGQSNRGRSNYGNYNHGNPEGEQRPKSKYDPTQYCQFHRAAGHSTEACYTKHKDENYMQFLQS